MATDKLILHRFMSRVEYLSYMSGEVLHNDTDHFRGGKGLSGKMKTAAKYKEKGCDIEIIDEQDFLEMLNAGK